MLSGQGTRIPVRVVISRTGWEEDVTRIDFTNALTLVGKSERNASLRAPGHGWEDNIKRLLQEIIFNKLGVIFLPQYRLWAVVDAALNQFA
jgi:hypothetical protein